MEGKKITKRGGLWQWVLAVAVVSLCYGTMRFSCCEEGLDGLASLETLYGFKAPLPFGKRLLTAWMAHGLTWAGLSIPVAFEWIEILGAAMLAEGLRRVFRPWLGNSWSRIAGLLVFGFLPLSYLLRSPLNVD